MEEKDFLTKAVDKLFEIKKSTLYIILFFILGFILRVLVALRKGFTADEMVHGTHTIGFISSGKLQIMDQSGLWMWLNDLFMKIFSVNMFGIRFTSILFGSLTVIVVYLIGKEIFNKKVGIIAALLSAISSFQLRVMEAGMDTSMTFFMALSIYFFVVFTKNKDTKYFYLIWIAVGLGVMMKSIALYFIPPLVISSFYYHWKKGKSIKLKQYLYAGILLLIIFLPVLSFNYLLYKDKGIVDIQFSKFTKMSSDVYADLSAHLVGFRPKTLFPGGMPGFPYGGLGAGLLFIYNTESIIAILLALIGLFFLFKDKNKFAFLLVSTFSLIFVLLAGTTLLVNHFVWASFYVMLLAAYGLNRGTSFIKNRKFNRIILYSIIILLAITSYLQLVKYSHPGPPGLFGQKNELGKLIDFKNENIEENALVVVDSRVYRGRIAFMFWDRNYLEGTSFIELMASQNQLPGTAQPIQVYYVDCIQEDCGWGTVRNQPEFNQSMEDLASAFEKNFNAEGVIKDTFGEPYFKVYGGKMPLKSSTIDIAKANKVWFYYPVNYNPGLNIFDNYETKGLFDKFLDKIAHYILYLEVAAALIFGAAVFYFLYKQDYNEKVVNNNPSL